MDLCAFAKKYYKTEQVASMYINSQSYGAYTYYSSAAKLDDVQEVNAYMSMNPLKYKNGKINRDKSHISSLKWLYVDLDYYKSEYAYMTKSQMLHFLKDDYLGIKVPYPTVIIDSGRGIYLLWLINEHVYAAPRWEKMQRYLYDQLKDLGADPQVTTDSARVFRKIGSINSKTGLTVNVLEYNDNRYCLSNLIRTFMPGEVIPTNKMISYAKHISQILNIPFPKDASKDELRKFIADHKELADKNEVATNAMIDYASAIQRTLGNGHELNGNSKQEVKNYIEKNKDVANLLNKSQYKGKCKVHYISNTYSLYRARLEDLETLLVKYRDKEGGYRESILFLYRYYSLCVTDSYSDSLKSTLSLNARLKHPLDEREVVKATASAEKYYDKGKSFNPSTNRIITMLGITKDEMMSLSCLVSKSVRYEKKKARSKERYLNKLKDEGKQTKKDQIEERKEQIVSLLAQGKNQSEICELLNISRSTFYACKKEVICTSSCATNDVVTAKDSEIQKEKILSVCTFKKKVIEGLKNFWGSPKNSASYIINKTFRSGSLLENNSIEIWDTS